MHERRTYADGEIVIRHGILRSGSGWLPVYRVNNGPVHRAWSNAMSREDAVIEAEAAAREMAAAYTGDWAVELIDVGEVERV